MRRLITQKPHVIVYFISDTSYAFIVPLYSKFTFTRIIFVWGGKHWEVRLLSARAQMRHNLCGTSWMSLEVAFSIQIIQTSVSYPSATYQLKRLSLSCGQLVTSRMEVSRICTNNQSWCPRQKSPPRGSSRTNLQVLVLILLLGPQVLVLVLILRP